MLMNRWMVLLTAALMLPACEQKPASSGGSSEGGSEKLVLYCGRKLSLAGDVIKAFEAETGIEVSIQDGKTPTLASRLMQEGDKSPADVFWSQDAGTLGQLSDRFEKLPESITGKVLDRFANPDHTWVGTSGRARVLAYSPKRVRKQDLPTSVFDLTDSKWKGRVGWAPTNGSFIAFVTAMRSKHGDEKTLAWLKAMDANGTKKYQKNTPIIEAIANNEIDLGLPNHYYLLRFKKSEGADYPVEQVFFADGDIGNLLFVAGAGVLKTAQNKEAARKFVDFLLSEKAQNHFTQNVFEYPLVEGIEPHEKLESLEKLQTVAPEVKFSDMDDIKGTVKLLKEAGLQ